MQQPRSPLPEDARFWDSLAEKVRLDAEGPLAHYAETSWEPARVPRTGWVNLLSRQAPWLVAASVLAIAGLVATLPESPTGIADGDGEVGRAEETVGLFALSLSPQELAGELIAGESAPSVGVFFVALSPASPSATSGKEESR